MSPMDWKTYPHVYAIVGASQWRETRLALNRPCSLLAVIRHLNRCEPVTAFTRCKDGYCRVWPVWEPYIGDHYIGVTKPLVTFANYPRKSGGIFEMA